MPTKPPTFGSPAKRDRRTYDHTKRKTDPALALAAKIRNSTQWQAVRSIVRAQHPLCRDPFGTHGKWPAAAEHVHHIIGIGIAPHLAFAPENLAPLCQPCHRRVEALERKGIATAGMFYK